MARVARPRRGAGARRAARARAPARRGGAAAAARPAHRRRRGRGLQLRLSARRRGTGARRAPSSCPSRRSPTRGPTRPATPAGCRAATRSCTPAGSRRRERLPRRARAASPTDRPVHGECGGFMVLGRALEDADGVTHPMTGLLGHVTSFAKRKMNLGYRQARLLADAPIGRAGATVRGHEFHYSRLVEPGRRRAARRALRRPRQPARPLRARGAAGSAAPSSTPSPRSEAACCEIVVIGIGTGNPEHMTVEAISALNAADLVLIPRKGAAKADLAELRRAICERYLDEPRDPDRRVRHAGARRRRPATATASRPGTAAIAGDLPRAARRRRAGTRGAAGLGRPVALRQHAAHPRPPRGRRARLRAGGWSRASPACRRWPPATASRSTAIGGPVHVTTGRRLREARAGGRVDRGDARRRLRLPRRCRRRTSTSTGAPISAWRRRSSSPGRSPRSRERIVEARAAARAANGWIMDTYLLRRR